MSTALLTLAMELLFPKLTLPPSSQELQELSIGMFRDLLEVVVRRDRKRMRKEVQRALVPLLFHLSDENPSVAKVQMSRLGTDADRGGLT